MTDSPAIPRGLTTVTYYAQDLGTAIKWYTKVVGVEPYLVFPDGYAEFRLGDFLHELGIEARSAPPESRDGVVVYWAVDDAAAAYKRLLNLGATPHSEPNERGPGYTTASVIDPFGNIFGVMTNAHYLAVLDEARNGLGDLSGSALARADY